MKHVIKYAVISLVAGLVAGPATAQSIFERFGWGETEEPQTPPDVARAAPTEPLPEIEADAMGLIGAWTVTTERSDPNCSLDGTAQISMTKAGGYTCELIMRDYCPNRWDGIIRQSCLIRDTGDAVFIDSTVLEALHGPLSGYSPDHFELYRKDDGSLAGNLRSYGAYPAIWRRVYDGIS